nr:NEDD8-conjugating enzyme Ubc12 [Tanacetum cinerariifolium]
MGKTIKVEYNYQTVKFQLPFLAKLPDLRKQVTMRFKEWENKPLHIIYEDTNHKSLDVGRSLCASAETKRAVHELRRSWKGGNGSKGQSGDHRSGLANWRDGLLEGLNVTYVDNGLVLTVECGVVCLNLSLIVFVCFLDISELNLPKTCSIKFPNGKDDLMNFQVTVKPDEGYYLGGKFTFTFQIATIYPHEAPKVKCKERVFVHLFMMYLLHRLQ